MDKKKSSTDWTAYYETEKSWWSTYTQKYTLYVIKEAIHQYVPQYAIDDGIQIAELGGGNSCFAASICDEGRVKRYDIFDNNELAVKLFQKMVLKARSYHGVFVDLLHENIDMEKERYDFVYSVGLIEHFTGEDIAAIIDRHFDYCKQGGVVLISFPTPTKKYCFIRKCMEMLGKWRFHDEQPLRYRDVESMFTARGEVLVHFINNKLPLTQMVVIARKK